MRSSVTHTRIRAPEQNTDATRVGANSRRGANARQREAAQAVYRGQLREKRSEATASFVRRISLPVLLVLLAGSSVYGLREAALHYGWIALREVQVTGFVHTTPEEVASLVGCHAGTPLTQLDLLRAKTRLEAQPWIASATVSRSFPHRLHVVLRERTALVRLPSGLWAAADGRLLPARGQQELPLLDIPWRGGAWLPSYAMNHARVLGDIAKYRPEVQARLELAQSRPDGSLRLRLKDLQPDLLIQPDNWNRGLARALVLERELGAEAASIARIDLRHGAIAALRPNAGGS
jgi:cell division protein FtsQ